MIARFVKTSPTAFAPKPDGIGGWVLLADAVKTAGDMARVSTGIALHAPSGCALMLLPPSPRFALLSSPLAEQGREAAAWLMPEPGASGWMPRRGEPAIRIVMVAAPKFVMTESGDVGL